MTLTVIDLVVLGSLLILGLSIGAAVSFFMVQKHLERKLEVLSGQNEIRAQRLGFTFVFSSTSGKPVVYSNVDLDFDLLSSMQVQKWLDARGLVMSPKGIDFTVKKREEA